MKTCCTSTTIPTTCPECEEIIDACCVIQQLPLPCLFPEPDLSGNIQASGSSGSTTIFVTANNNIGIKIGDFLTSESTPLVDVNSMVTAVVLTSTGATTSNYTVTLDKPTIAGSGTKIKVNLVRYQTEIPQCEVNEALSQVICDLSANLACCSDWQDITGFNASGDYIWADATAEIEPQGAQYLIPSSCNCNTVKLRGTLMGPWLGNLTLMLTLPAGIEPLKPRSYSVNVLAQDILGSPTTQDIFPALIFIIGNEVFLRLKDYCCNDEHSFDPARWVLYVSLEGISFEVDV